MAAVDTFYDLPGFESYLLDLTRYPSMTPVESEIVRAWLMLHIQEFDRIAFNVRMGTGQSMPAGTDPAIERMARELTQKRADIVAIKGDIVTIVEVKVRLALATLGQLLGYSTIWKAEHPESREVRLIAIARDALLDVPEMLLTYGVAVETFPSIAVTEVPPTA